MNNSLNPKVNLLFYKSMWMQKLSNSVDDLDKNNVHFSGDIQRLFE